MGVEELKKLMNEIKQRADKEPDWQATNVLQLIEQRLAEGLHNPTETKK
ncbi:hypothetical protein LGQ02_19495 [Bacillus shivajii]|nr:hypothetical protein [Bacillus shivajii]UCZ52939.1 hypothetical protein LGQ02_19495 [Bacillus shivajii]